MQKVLLLATNEGASGATGKTRERLAGQKETKWADWKVVVEACCPVVNVLTDFLLSTAEIIDSTVIWP